MSKSNLEEMIAKVKKFGKILSLANIRGLRAQEEKAIKEAMRIQSMHPEKFKKKEKQQEMKHRRKRHE
jgi:hypothetical protein